MKAPDPCNHTLLASLLADQLSEAEVDALDAHLDACEACRDRLEALAADRAWWDDLAAIGLESTPDGPSPADDEFPADFLEPPGDRNCLGLLGPYEVGGEIGRGGMGVVLKGYHAELNRPVAIKILSPRLATSSAARRRFAREARAAAAIASEHVVPIYAVDTWKGLPYLVMPYIQGGSLQSRIARGGPLGTEEILRIALQAARGLAAAHEQGLVHRDIKPANILLEDGVDRARITDFGLARTADDASLTQSGAVAGTPQFMSPEQARGEPVDARSDLFSLGSVMYAMASGAPPFRAPTPLAVLRRVSDQPARPIREINPSIPPRLAEIVVKLHAKDADRRYQSASALADELCDCLADFQGGAEPGVGWEGGLPARSPWPRRALVAATALILLAFGLGAAGAGGIQEVAEYVGTILRIRTPEGTLVVHLDDPAIKLDIDGESLAITGPGAQEIRLRTGAHRLLATRGGSTVHEEVVSISRGDKTVVRVSREPNAPALEPLPPIAANTPAPPIAKVERPAPPAERREPGNRPFPYVVRPDNLPNPDPNPDPAPLTPGPNGPVAAPLRWFVVNANGLAIRSDIWESKHPEYPRFPMVGGGLTYAWEEVPKGIPKISLNGSKSGTARFATYSPDGKTLAFGGSDGIIRLWDVPSGSIRAQLSGHAGEVHRALFTPDGKTLISSGKHDDLRAWDVAKASLAEPAPPEEARRVGAYAISPDGATLATVNPAQIVTLWDLAAWKPRLSFRSTGVESAITTREMAALPLTDLAFSPDGRRLAGAIGREGSNEPGQAIAWDVQSGSVLANLRGQKLPDWDAAFTPDGKILASSSSDGTVKLWDTANWTAITALRSKWINFRSMAISKDGTRLAGGHGNGIISLWDLTRWQPIGAIQGHSGEIYDVEFSPDGRTLATAGWDMTVKLWDVEAIPKPRHEKAPESAR